MTGRDAALFFDGAIGTTWPVPRNGRIGDLAIHVGFAEHSTFNRAFRRRFGDTPTGVRRIRGG